ncbi:uncharacterized protein LOC141853810 [Brevipalpus obovatus]|uniref:uncharacterized protein LOC141853810 n=1 Tax=Brevipalpus obovatus TaxID=246614 RepID=UPI003D9DBADF
MSRMDSLIGFAMCVFMGFICFILAGFYLPLIVFKARKFCLLFTLGSLFWVGSFAFIYGPKEHLKNLFSKERAIFTTTYLASLIATLYTSLVLKVTVLTIIMASIQLVALTWYLFSYFPGGTTSLWFFSKGFTRMASQTLPV